VAIIDGGTDDSGEAIIKHVRGVYGDVLSIDVISTHSDSDHSCGLRTVLR
jgi:glyoxylase-like metal-dependent hydrolase (beta-lactamase superfamily II)